MLDTWFEARLQARLLDDHAFGWAYYDHPHAPDPPTARYFVQLDNRLGQVLPHLAGLYAPQLEEYYDSLFRTARFNFLGNLQGPFLEGEGRREEHDSLPAPEL